LLSASSTILKASLFNIFQFSTILYISILIVFSNFGLIFKSSRYCFTVLILAFFSSLDKSSLHSIYNFIFFMDSDSLLATIFSTNHVFSFSIMFGFENANEAQFFILFLILSHDFKLKVVPASSFKSCAKNGITHPYNLKGIIPFLIDHQYFLGL